MFFKNKSNILTQEQVKVKYLLRYCDLTDLEKISTQYISRKSKVIDSQTQLERMPTREEYEKAIINKVALDILIDMKPKLKDKLKQLSEQ